MIQLTEEQCQALAAETPPRVIDPVTKKSYILVPVEVYEQMKRVFEDDVRGMQHLLADLAPEDWEDIGNYESKP